MLSFFILSLLFKDRFGSHHYIILLPLLYVQISVIICKFKVPDKIITIKNILLVTLFSSLFYLNTSYQSALQDKLTSTGGSGYYSDSTKQLALDALHKNNLVTSDVYIFSEWGFSAPFVIMTEGKIQYRTSIDEYDLNKIPCGTNLNYVAWGNVNNSDSILSSAESMGKNPIVKYYYERNGNLSFSVYTINKIYHCPKA